MVAVSGAARKERAYEAHLSGGSTAVMPIWSPHPELHRAKSPIPMKRIAENALRAVETGVPDRLRSGDLLRERQACWLDYTFFRSPQTRKPHDSSQAALSDLRMNAAEKVCHT